MIKYNVLNFSKGMLLGVLLLAAWIAFFIAYIPDRWGDSYSYLVSIRCSMDSNYGDFWFGKMEHPLYTFLLFCFGKMFQSDIVAAKALSIISYSITLLMLYRIARITSGQWASVLAVLLASVVFLDYTQHGLAVLSESFMSALVISAVYFHLKDRPVTVGVLVGIAALVRSEFLFVLAAILLIRAVQKRWRSMILLSFASFPFILWWVLTTAVYYIKMQGIGLSRISRDPFYFHMFIPNLIDAVGLGLHRLTQLLHGSAILANALMAIVLTAGLFLYLLRLWKQPPGQRLKNCLQHTGFFFVVFIVLNMFSMMILYAMNRHPLSVRHFFYVAPYIILLLVMALATMDAILSESARWLRRVPVVSAAAAIVLAYCVYFPATVYIHGHGSFRMPFSRLYDLHHYVDGEKNCAEWLVTHLKPGEKFISIKPSVWYYSRYRSDRVYTYYPKNLLDPKAYQAMGVRYVAWTDMRSGSNWEAREVLAPLKNGKDFLFFKHILEPRQKGWALQLYEVLDDTLDRQLTAFPAKGWHGPEKWGRWASSPNPVVEVHSTQARKAILEFSIGSFVEPATVTIVLNDRPVETIEVAVKKGDRSTPTFVRLEIDLKPGINTLQFSGPKEMFVPEKLGQWEDPRALRLGFSHMTLNGMTVL